MRTDSGNTRDLMFAAVYFAVFLTFTSFSALAIVFLFDGVLLQLAKGTLERGMTLFGTTDTNHIECRVDRFLFFFGEVKGLVGQNSSPNMLSRGTLVGLCIIASLIAGIFSSLLTSDPAHCE